MLPLGLYNIYSNLPILYNLVFVLQFSSSLISLFFILDKWLKVSMSSRDWKRPRHAMIDPSMNVKLQIVEYYSFSSKTFITDAFLNVSDVVQ